MYTCRSCIERYYGGDSLYVWLNFHQIPFLLSRTVTHTHIKTRTNWFSCTVFGVWVFFVCSSDVDCHQTHSIANHLFNISYSFLYYQYHCVGVLVWSFWYSNTAFESSFTGKLYKTLVFEFHRCVNVTLFPWRDYHTENSLNDDCHHHQQNLPFQQVWNIWLDDFHSFFLHDIWFVSTKWKFSGTMLY